jgi:hypothetical protein
MNENKDSREEQRRKVEARSLKEQRDNGKYSHEGAQ